MGRLCSHPSPPCLTHPTHSPFLVDADRLERARKVFVERDGSTRVSGDLGVSEGSDSKRGAGFAVRAALHISVADAVLGGARPVLVNSHTDQIYLSILKTFLVGAGRFKPQREIVFTPAKNPQVMRTMAALLAMEDVGQPPIILNGTDEGQAQAKKLLTDSYCDCPENIVRLDDITGLADAQVEDVIGADLIVPLVDRIERRPDRLFVDRVATGTALVKQIEAWADDEEITLEPDWRVKLANRVRSRILQLSPDSLPQSTLHRWEKLITKLEPH